MKRALAAALTALALSGTAACTDAVSGTSNPQGELSDVQHTLDAIEADMAGDPAP